MTTRKYLYIGLSLFSLAFVSLFLFSTNTTESLLPLPVKTSSQTKVKVAVLSPKEENPNPQTKVFKKLTQETLSHLVKDSDIVVHSYQDIHDVPKETFRNSEAFGAIMDALKANPALAPEAMDFYEKCANNEEALFSTRAVCLSHLVYWGNRTHTPINTSRYSEDLVRVSKNLPIVW